MFYAQISNYFCYRLAFKQTIFSMNKQSYITEGITYLNTVGILVIKGAEELFLRLKENNFYTTYRNGNIRLSCHFFYTDESDLMALKSHL